MWHMIHDRAISQQSNTTVSWRKIRVTAETSMSTEPFMDVLEIEKCDLSRRARAGTVTSCNRCNNWNFMGR